VAASRFAEDEFGLLSLLPVVPAVPAAPLPDVPVALAPAVVFASVAPDVADPLPIRSTSSLFIAATSVAQLAFAADVGSAAADEEARLSAAMCRFNSASCVFAGPSTDPALTSSSAAFACCRCSSGDV